MKSEVINKRSFLSVILILVLMIILSGILTQILPMGSYERVVINGQTRIVHDSYTEITGQRLPIWKWFIAPIEVLFTEGSTIIFVITAFLLFISGSISTLNHAGIIEDLIYTIISKFKTKPYILLSIITFFFMSLGSFIGIFEEVIPLIPIVIMLIDKLGFDKMTGLGISLLATGFGFSAAITNPFTIGVAQQIAGVELFSGIIFRVVIFAITYLTVIGFVLYHSKRTRDVDKINIIEDHVSTNKGSKFFIIIMLIMISSIIASSFIPLLRDINLILIGLLFIIAALVGSKLCGYSLMVSLKEFLQGMISILPGVFLILLAVSVKHIIVTGKIMDTILYRGSTYILSSTPLMSLIYVYILVLILNFFIGSGSAKAFIVIPIIMPLLDMVGISRQLGVLAFQFGDGFSNVLYPTNAVLLIALSLTDTKITKWIKWIMPIQILLIGLSILFLAIGLLINYM